MEDKPTGYVIVIGTYYNDVPHTFRSVRTLGDADAIMRAAGYVNRSSQRTYVRYYEKDSACFWARVYRSETIPRD